MKFTNQICTLAIATVLGCVTSSPCLAGVIVSESGAIRNDTGDFVTGVVQDLTMTSDLMTINGTLEIKPLGPDIDVFKIKIENVSSFSATLRPAIVDSPDPNDPFNPSNPFGPLDPILYLFDSGFNAVVADNDGDIDSKQLSRLTLDSLDVPVTSGDFYLVVTSFLEFTDEVLPVNTFGEPLFLVSELADDSFLADPIFTPKTGTILPSVPPARRTFGGWLSGPGPVYDFGGYELQLTGLASNSAVVPEPTSALIWAASGLVMLPTFRRRRRKNQITGN